MDPLTEDFSRPEEMTMLTHEDISEENADTHDDVENLQNSFLEAVDDENVQPKMQCLMMDSSFSMVTMQGEDSGIEWETTPSRSTTPWTSEAGNLSADLSTVTAMGPASPGTCSAGKIIFVMGEELISRQKRAKEKGHGSKGKAATQQNQSSDNISGRPELFGFSEPNVNAKPDECEEEAKDPSKDKEQTLFTLVSEGSEILNIIVPSKMATVDEEESKEIEDNLSYLEASTVVKANEENHDQIFEQQNEEVQTHVPSELSVSVIRPTGAHSMDPPGAPVPKPSTREPPNVEYFEAFAQIDGQAPGSPAITEQEAEGAIKTLDTEKTCQAKVTSNTSILSVDEENADISLVELTSELLDDVFYGNTDNYSKTADTADNRKRIPSKLSLKQTGATLFGSEEDILTPIYLPEGPPKIIDPILLEEPKAMAFLYTDLYEEATGSRKKEEDTESMSSEKSFHSRHSDREARGYLEKYVLIDETPVLEQQMETLHPLKDSPRIISSNVYKFNSMGSKKEKNPIGLQSSSEEVTDFGSSANSSPCTLEPSSHLAEEDVNQTETKNHKKCVIVTEEVTECTTDSLDEFALGDPDWESAFDDVISVREKEEIVNTQQPLEHMDMQLPVASPSPWQKASPFQKFCLDLAPLTPVDIEEEVEAGAKEEREEEKETASPAETADEGDEEEPSETSSEPTSSQNTITPDETTDGVIHIETNTTVGEPSSPEENIVFGENNETLEENVSENVTAVSDEETKEDSTKGSHDEAKETGKCIIL